MTSSDGQSDFSVVITVDSLVVNQGRQRYSALMKDGTIPGPESRAVVIGAGIGGLAAAMRLGVRGYHVTVVDRLDSAGGRGTAIHRDGHRFDLGPTIITVPGIFRDLWAACGRDFDADVTLKAIHPFYEIRWPDGSNYIAHQHTDQIRAEVERLSPGDVHGVMQFLRDAEKRYTFGFEDLGRRPLHKLWDLIRILPRFGILRADRSVYRHAALRVKDDRLRMALSFHPLFIGGDPFHVTSMYTLVSYLEKKYGVHYAIGGVAAMARAMVEIVRSRGGEVIFSVEADEIKVTAGRASGVKLTDGRVLQADIVVSNADPWQTYDRLLRNQWRKRWTTRHLKSRRWSMGLFVWHFGTRGTRGMWADVGHHTILNGPRYKGLVDDIFLKGKLADDMSLYVHRPSITDPTVAPAGDDTFYALSPVPHLGWENPVDWSTQAEPYRQKMQEMLEQQLLPGLGNHLAASEVFTPETFRDRYLSPLGTGFSMEPRIFQSAWFRPHNISEELPGLFLAGAGTHPGAGLPGVVAGAEVLDQLIPGPVSAMVDVPMMKAAE